MFFFVRHYFDKKFKERDTEDSNRAANRMERLQTDDKLQHAYGRILFWMYRAIVTGQHNGELEAAFKELQDAEEQKKDLDRKIIAESANE